MNGPSHRIHQELPESRQQQSKIRVATQTLIRELEIVKSTLLEETQETRRAKFHVIRREQNSRT